MKHKFVLFILTFLLSIGIQYAVAQNGPSWCPMNSTSFEESATEKMMNCTGYSTTDYENKYSWQSTYIPDNHTPVKVIKIAFHFFQDANGGNMWANNPATLALFDSVVSNLNKHKSNISPPSWPINGVSHISDARIRFELTGIYFYQNDSLNSIDSTHAKFDAAIAAVDPDRLNSLGIYYTGSTYLDSGQYAAGIAEPYDAINSVIIFNNGLYNNPGLGTLDHELGHCLRLKHTYNQGPDILIKTDKEYLSDVFDVSWGNYCSPLPNMACPHQAGWNWDPNDHVAHPYATNNIMGGCLDTYYMSPLQLGRSHRTLALFGIRKYVKEMISEAAYPWTINSDETWDFDIQMYQDIVVKKDNTLTIKCKVGMANNGRIIVERGARLIIDGGEVFAWGTSWEGVQVWGTSSQRQIINANGYSTDQGIVKVINGGTLRGARNAIVTTKTDPNGDIDWNGYFGGIIQCDGAQFINNHVSVAFMVHHNSVANVIVPNLSYIRRSTFEVDNNMALKEPNDPYLNAFVSLWGVEGVKLEGNSYKNNCNPLPAIANRGTGIVSYDGSYTLSRYRVCSVYGSNGCAGYSVDQPSEFANLHYGVHATESSALASITINENDFENCNRSVYMFGTQNTKIVKNQIQVGEGTVSDYPYGIYSDWSTAYDISNNEITTYGTDNSVTTGICINNTRGYSNKLYRNKMDDLHVGTTIIGDNRGTAAGEGLRFECNEYGQNNQNNFDIWLSNQTVDPGKIDVIQGSNSKGANNKFSHFFHGLGSQYDYYDESYSFSINPVQYYFNPGALLETEPFYYTPSLNVYNLTTPLNWATMCPEYRNTTGTGGGLHNRLNAITTLNTDQLNLQAQIDNNNTEWFLDAISGAITVPVADLKQALVNASPYLSDEVLIAVFQSPLVTNDNIASLHKKNAPVTPVVWEVLNGLSLPESIRVKLNTEQNQTTPSARAILEASISEIQHQKQFEIDEGIKELLNDSLGYSPDSLLLLIEAGSAEELNNRLATFYVSTNQVVEATEHFQMLRQTQGSLNTFCRLQEIILTLKQSGQDVFSLKNNTELKEEVEDIANNLQGPAHANALSLLSLVFGTNLEEDVVLPDELGAKDFLQNQNGIQDNQKGTAQTLKLFPNPTTGNIYVSNSLEGEFDSAELFVYDIGGNQLMTQVLFKEESSVKLMTERLKAGVYFIYLIVDGQQIEAQKFVKQ